MGSLKRILVAVVALLASLAYVWVAAVRAAPGVRRRKQEARRTGAWRPPGN